MVVDEATGKIHEFTKSDIVEGDFTSPEAEEAFMKVITILQDPTLSLHNFFEYKTKGHPKNSEETEKYLEQLFKKVDEIVPVIKNAKTIAEIKNYGKIDTTETAASINDGAEMIGNAKPTDILKESLPEIDGSVLNEVAPKSSITQSENVDDILNS